MIDGCYCYCYVGLMSMMNLMKFDIELYEIIYIFMVVYNVFLMKFEIGKMKKCNIK